MRTSISSIFIFCGVLMACTNKPADIPRDAARHWGFKSDYTWTWKRDLKHGCVAWMAKESWAVLRLSKETPCKGKIGEGILSVEGKGVMYSSIDDFLVFKEYWPWSSKIYGSLFIYDEEGMIDEVLPCPFALTEDQVKTIRAITVEAVKSAETDGELRMLNRVKERLSRLEYTALEASQFGCADKPNERDENGKMVLVDEWVIETKP